MLQHCCIMLSGKNICINYVTVNNIVNVINYVYVWTPPGRAPSFCVQECDKIFIYVFFSCLSEIKVAFKAKNKFFFGMFNDPQNVH